jgi:hypothetical protein
MAYKVQLRKRFGDFVSQDEEDNIRKWIKEYLQIEDTLKIEKYAIAYTAYHQWLSNFNRIKTDFAALDNVDFITKYSMVLHHQPIEGFMYNKDDFDEDFPEWYEELHSNPA